MADIHDIKDIYLLSRFAEVNGYSLQELLGDLSYRGIDIKTAVKVIEFTKHVYFLVRKSN